MVERMVERMVEKCTVEKNQNILVDTSIDKLLLLNLYNPKYKITQFQSRWIKKFIYLSQSLFKDIINKIHTLFPNKIEIFDIPILIKIISEAYFEQTSLIKMYDCDIIILFIQFTFDVSLDNKFFNIIEIDNKSDEINKMIITCISLLTILNKPSNISWFGIITLYFNELIEAST